MKSYCLCDKLQSWNLLKPGFQFSFAIKLPASLNFLTDSMGVLGGIYGLFWTENYVFNIMGIFVLVFVLLF